MSEHLSYRPDLVDMTTYKQNLVKSYQSKGFAVSKVDVSPYTGEATIEISDGWAYIHDINTGNVSVIKIPMYHVGWQTSSDNIETETGSQLEKSHCSIL